MRDALDTADTIAVQEAFVAFSTSRDPSLRWQLIEAHLGLARRLARKFLHRGEQWTDLVQVASIALVKAVDRYDPELAVRFSTYATATIVGELKRHFRDHVWGIRPRRSIQELYLQLGRVISAFSQEHGRSPTIDELAREAGASQSDVLEALEASRNYYPLSLDDRQQRAGDDVSTIADQLGWADPGFSKVETRDALRQAVNKLPATERQVVYLRFYEGLTQREIAEKVGVSQMHVSRLLSRALDQLRALASVWA